ncbi:hypothetical protein TWF569_002474 [Orbilia oligospora]|uniref:AA1-like domain-containing protein n=1 Tax=Orbilia oligospora TaxID=2813651 RepID=A0A6G1LU15_ORBOL|nr:hypothetical protein TWF102_007948 [Orbilia oligospora]KAF3106343.1 hypothetical protein TWF103_006432 [Orbilia oligospora]KAF3110996.1 hypothetical protein TWF706_000445 [Orbilia oligospora]KAF3121842.1 hypothetical protein TWF569_002474 [Orbilia oligospora]KAF3144508.1 hypothetical protein TWF594_004670 [Orbilia oligospora]
MRPDLILLALAGSAFAAPNAAAEARPAVTERPSIARRGNVGGVYFTLDINFAGSPSYNVYALNTCINLSAPYLRKISSFGPDEGTICTIYGASNCGTQAGVATIYYPGSKDLRSFGNNWNDRIASFKCVAGRPASSVGSIPWSISRRDEIATKV